MKVAIPSIDVDDETRRAIAAANNASGLATRKMIVDEVLTAIDNHFEINLAEYKADEEEDDDMTEDHWGMDDPGDPVYGVDAMPWRWAEDAGGWIEEEDDDQFRR